MKHFPILLRRNTGINVSALINRRMGGVIMEGGVIDDTENDGGNDMSARKATKKFQECIDSAAMELYYAGYVAGFTEAIMFKDTRKPISAVDGTPASDAAAEATHNR